MRTIYIDHEHKCHVTDDGSMTAIVTDFFDDKCDTFTEGFCLEPADDGNCKIYPWKPMSELEAAQREYERQLLAEYQSTIADMESALNKLGVSLNESVD